LEVLGLLVEHRRWSIHSWKTNLRSRELRRSNRCSAQECCFGERFAGGSPAQRDRSFGGIPRGAVAGRQGDLVAGRGNYSAAGSFSAPNP